MATWTYSKKAGAPAGTLTIQLANNSYTINDTTTPTISVSTLSQASDLALHPYLILSTLTGTSLVPVPVYPVGMVSGKLNRFDQNGTATVFDGSELPAGGGGGSSTLAGDTDVTITTPSNGQVLIYNSATSKWVNGAAAGVASFNTRTGAVTLTKADVTGTGLSYTDIGTPVTLAADTDVVISAPSNGQVLTYNSGTSKWINAAGGAAGVSSFNTRTGAVVLSKADVTATGLAAADVSAQAAAAVTGAPATSLSSAFNVAMSALVPQWVTGTLANATTTATFTSIVAGGQVHFQLTQDGTGGRAFVINDGAGHTTTLVIPTDPGASFEVIVESPDGSTLFITVLGGRTGPTYAVLSADMASIASQTTLQPISGLSLPIGSSLTEIWKFNWTIFLTAANATMDYKLGLTLPASATAKWGFDTGAAAANAGFVPTAVAGTGALAMGIESTVLQAGTSGVSLLQGVQLTGLIFGGGTAGNVTLTYAQNTSDAGTLVVNKGSMVSAVRLKA